MRKTILAATAAFVIGGIATGAVLSQAQPAPPPAQQMDAGPQDHHWAGGWGRHRGPQGEAWRRPGMGQRPLALVYRARDRQLTPADVQKIAEAFLLWNGNHTWKVIDVASNPDGAVGFSLATPDGSVIAKFTMDPHSGRIHRVG